MDTRKLYYEDAYLREFSARVLDCQPWDQDYGVILDQTCFYPQGGGQPGDTGTLGGVRVTDTQIQDGVILHRTAAPLAPGETVKGEIDWPQRLDRMVQHAGEHMVSGVVHRRYGYDNVGFHMGADVMTIDFSGPLRWEQLLEVEQEVNHHIWQDLEVRCYVPPREELAQIPYRSKKALTGDVRIVEIPGVDVCACCGTHVRRTGEIGLVAIGSVEKFHEGVRVELRAGQRAFQYLRQLSAQNRQISQLLSAKPMETAPAVERLAAELEKKKQQLHTQENARFADKAQELAGRGDVLVRMDDLEPEGLRRAVVAIQARCGGRAAVFSGDDDHGYQYAVGWPGGDLRDWVRAMNQRLNGRGGGKPGFVQGSVRAKWDEIVAFVSPEGPASCGPAQGQV